MTLIPVLWQRGMDFDDPIDGWLNPHGRRSPYGQLYPRQTYGMPKRNGPKYEQRKWSRSVALGNFRPEHVKVKVEGGKVLIHAKYVEGDEQWGDTIEKRRTVDIPDDVDHDQIHTRMASGGTLILEAPYIESGYGKEKQLQIIRDSECNLVPSDRKNSIMSVNVGDFKPEEVSVTYKDGVLTAKGSRERNEGGRVIKESFFQQRTVPNSVNVNGLKAFQDPDGMLTVHVPGSEDARMYKKKKILSLDDLFGKYYLRMIEF